MHVCAQIDGWISSELLDKIVQIFQVEQFQAHIICKKYCQDGTDICMLWVHRIRKAIMVNMFKCNADFSTTLH